MAKKTEAKTVGVDDVTARFKRDVQSGKILYGAEQALKGLRNGSVARVYLSSNCAKEFASDIRRYAQLSSTEVIGLSYPNDEVGTLCKKPFSISVAAVQK